MTSSGIWGVHWNRCVKLGPSSTTITQASNYIVLEVAPTESSNFNLVY